MAFASVPFLSAGMPFNRSTTKHDGQRALFSVRAIVVVSSWHWSSVTSEWGER